MNVRNLILLALLGVVAYMFATGFRDIKRYKDMHDM